MDNNVPPRVEIEGKVKTDIPEKKFVIFYSDENTPEGTDGKYIIIAGLEQALLATMELKKNGATKIAVYKQVELKITLT